MRSIESSKSSLLRPESPACSLIDAGLLKLAPIDATADLFEAYLEALWTLLRDPRYFPLFDDRIADLVDAAVREGTLKPTSHMRSRGRQAGVATGFLARLPTFPLATMDEVVDIRAELDRPLVRFRAEMVNVAGNLGVDAFDPAFDQAAEEAWISKVRPALLELEELVEEKHLLTQFGAKLPGGGLVGAAGGLVTGIITDAPLIGVGVAAGAAVITAAATVGGERAKLEREIRQRPYYLLHRTEELLGAESR